FSGRIAAKTAEKISRPSHTTEAQNQNPSFFLRYWTSLSVASGGWIPISVSASATSSTDISHPWVESGVEQIDEEVDQHEADGDDDHHALDDEEVLLEDGRAEERPQPGQREDRLDDEGAADERRRVDADDRQQRERRRPQGVAPQDPAVGHALGLGGGDEVLLQRRDHVRSQHPHVTSRLRGGEGHGG